MDKICSRATILSAERIRRGLEARNVEVMLVLGSALNPSKFASQVDADAATPTDPAYANYVVFRVRKSGNAYAVHKKTILSYAMEIATRTGNTCEILSNKPPTEYIV
jgi:hypothetical protein